MLQISRRDPADQLALLGTPGNQGGSPPLPFVADPVKGIEPQLRLPRLGIGTMAGNTARKEDRADVSIEFDPISIPNPESLSPGRSPSQRSGDATDRHCEKVDSESSHGRSVTTIDSEEES